MTQLRPVTTDSLGHCIVCVDDYSLDHKRHYTVLGFPELWGLLLARYIETEDAWTIFYSSRHWSSFRDVGPMGESALARLRAEVLHYIVIGDLPAAHCRDFLTYCEKRLDP